MLRYLILRFFALFLQHILGLLPGRHFLSPNLVSKVFPIIFKVE